MCRGCDELNKKLIKKWSDFLFKCLVLCHEFCHKLVTDVNYNASNDKINFESGDFWGKKFLGFLVKIQHIKKFILLYKNTIIKMNMIDIKVPLLDNYEKIKIVFENDHSNLDSIFCQEIKDYLNSSNNDKSQYNKRMKVETTVKTKKTLSIYQKQYCCNTNRYILNRRNYKKISDLCRKNCMNEK